MSPLPEVLLTVARSPVLAIGLPVGLGALVGYGTDTKSTWYTTMKQPPMAPPTWAFGPVWSALYAAAGYASHLVYRAGEAAPFLPGSQDALKLYYAQMALNYAWMPLFFTVRSPLIALVDIVALSATVFKMTSLMSELPTRIDCRYLLYPYCAWLGYATYLNASLVYLNWNHPRKRI